MILAIKSLIGAAIIGTGALVPVVANKVGIKDIKEVLPEKVVDAIKSSPIIQKAKREATTRRTNDNVAKALKMLSDKGCKLMQNPQNPNNWFNSLYGCKKDKESKSEFYYLGSRDSLANENDSSLIKKVTSVNYLGGWNEVKADLELTLENSSKVEWEVYARSGWKYFKNVNLENSCKIETPMLGKDVLRCSLKDSYNGNESFYYSFAIF